VEVGEIGTCARRALQRLDVVNQLNEITRNKARRQAKMAHDLDEQPCGIAAGTGAQRQRLFATLDAGFMRMT